MRSDLDFSMEGKSSVDDMDEPIAVWTLDELDEFADLASVGSDWARGDDRNP